MKYIDAEKIRSEVERIKEANCASPISVCNDILSFIDYLKQEQSISSNLDEVAEEYANKEYPDEPCVGRWGTGDYETPVDNEYPREIAKDAFKAGANTIIDQRVSLGYLISWYIQSVDVHQPIWTEEHLKELDKDFILIPKPLNNH